MDANYQMTVNLFEACLVNDINPRILIPGSGEEFGEINEDELPITEDTILRPVNPYAVTKIAQDLIGYVYHRSYGLNVVRTRAFNHEGPRRSNVFGIPWYAYQVAKIERGLQEPVLKVGHVDDRRNFTHITDMVAAYEQLAAQCDYPLHLGVTEAGAVAWQGNIGERLIAGCADWAGQCRVGGGNADLPTAHID